MSLLLSKIPQFFAPESLGGGGKSTTLDSPSMGKEDVIEFLNEDDDDKKDVLEIGRDKSIPDKGDTKTGKSSKQEVSLDASSEDDEPAEGQDEDDDELKDIEEELEGPTEEQLELVTPVRRKEILKKYPALFKDFPYLEKAYYREQQFTELLPTINDARAAVEKAQTLDTFENDLMSGNSETLLKAVRAQDEDAFNKIVDDYLPALARVDEKAYFHVLSNVTKHTIVAMVKEAKNSNNEVLQNAAQILNQFVFGSSDFRPPTNLSRNAPKDDAKDNELMQREQQFVKTQFTNTRDDLNTRVNNTLRNTIDANIDPKSSMSDYVRRNASKDALETLEVLISKDTRFKTLADKLWEKAFEENFSKTATDRIRSAYLSKAKSLLPSVIKKARNDALRGSGKRVVDDDREEKTPNRGPIAPGQPRSQERRGKISKPEDIPKKMSTLDFLNSD